MATEPTSEANEAADLVDFFSDKFSEWYGNGHIILACHAAFPVSVTVDMLYQIWANFKNYTDSRQHPKVIPILAVSDLLLSPLFRQTGKDLYEMPPDTRALLLDKLKTDSQFGDMRIKELAAFLFQYIQQLPDRPDLVNFKEAQKWTALLTVSPDLASQYILESLIDKVNQGYVNSSIGITNLIEFFTKENKTFINDLADKLQPVTNEEVISAPTVTSSKKLVITDQPIAGKPVFNLPPHISNRLRDIKPVAAAMEERVTTTTKEEDPGKLYALVIGINQYNVSNSPLLGSVKDADNIIECLTKNHLLLSEDINLLKDEAATKEPIRASLEDILEQASFTDTVLIYFSGHAVATEDKSCLALTDYDFSRSSVSESITDHEMKEWVSNYAKNNPKIVLIIDSHTGSRNWLDESNPRHVQLMATHLWENAGELGEKGGIFTNALVQTIDAAKGRLTYRELYRDTVYNLHIDSAITQLPMFITAGNTWDHYIFSNKKINPILQQQKLLNECGYPLPQDGMEGPKTKAAKKQFLQDHGIDDESRLLHYLQLKIALQQKGKIELAIIIQQTPAVFENVFNDDSLLVQYIKSDVFSGEAANPKNTRKTVAFPEMEINLLNTDTFIVCVSEANNRSNQFIHRINRLLDIAFALDKEIVLFDENAHLPSDKRFNHLPWTKISGSLEDEDGKLTLQLNKVKALLVNLLQQNRQNSNAHIELYKKRIAESHTSGILVLSDMNLAEIPPEVFELTKLKELYLEGNNITDIPDAVSQLKSLQVLNLNSNPVRSLPGSLLKLRNLQVLALNNTGLDELPSQIDKLESLRELLVHSTKLVILPDALSGMDSLEIVDARENNILNIPQNILTHKKADRLREYMKGMAEKNTNPALLIISGDGINTTGIAGIAARTAEQHKFEWARHTKIQDPPSLYAVVKNQVADNCLIYLYDKEGLLFRGFGSAENGERLRNLQQFITALGIPSINLFYDGDVVNPEFCRQLVKITGVNAVIAKVADYKQPAGFKNLFFNRLLTGTNLTTCMNLGIVQNTHRKSGTKLFYELFKSDGFTDFKIGMQATIKKEKPASQKKSAPGQQTIIADRIAAAQRSNSLDLSGLQLKEIPAEVWQLSKLKELNMSQTAISEIPQQIYRMQNLASFIADQTAIRELPEEFFALTKMEKLSFNQTPLDFLPETIAHFANLKWLSLENTHLTTLPIELVGLKKLSYLSVKGAALLNMPEKILKDKKGASLRNYFLPKKAPRNNQASVLEAGFSRSKIQFETGKLVPYSNLNTKELLPVLEAIREKNAVAHHLVIFNDTTGIYAKQFGADNFANNRLNQYFSCFPASLNIINNGSPLPARVVPEMIRKGQVNSFIQGDPVTINYLPGFMSDLLVKAGLSYLQTLKFVNDNLQGSASPDPDVLHIERLGYEICYNPADFKDFSFWTKNDIATHGLLENTISTCRFLTPAVIKNILLELKNKKPAAEKKAAIKKRALQKKTAPKKKAAVKAKKKK